MERRVLASKVAAPPAVTYAVGDVHGRSDLLFELMQLLAKHRATVPGKAAIVFLGDYVNRGPDTWGVIDFLRGLTGFDEVICLEGNHDLLFREALKSKDGMARWLENGGTETFASYGCEPAKAAARIPAAHVNFLASLRRYYDDGVRLFVHAGLRPGLALAAATAEDLLWYRGKSADVRGRLVVHGHSPVEVPFIDCDEVNVDTKAWKTGRLTCAVFRGSSRKPTFIATTGAPQPASQGV